jgi:hypothetical protein
MLRLGQEKVQFATQQGAIGNGVPLLAGLATDPMSYLQWIGPAMAVGIAVVMAAKLLTPSRASDAITAQ